MGRDVGEGWDHPEAWSTLHRSSIARVVEDSIVLDGNTMEEIEKTHKSVLEAAVAHANREFREYEAQRMREAAEKSETEAKVRREVEEAADRMKFGEK